MRTFNCPNCGANLIIRNDSRDFAFCQYCGTKIMLDDFRSTHRVIDEAKIKQVEIEGEIRLRELKIREAQINQKNQLRKALTYIWVGLIFLIAVLCIIIWTKGGENRGVFMFMCLILLGVPIIGGGARFIFKVMPEKENEKELIQNGNIKFPTSLGYLPEQDYTVVQKKIQSAGFYNITCINMHDLTLGILYKPGRVESVTVGGENIRDISQKKSSCQMYFMPDVPIVITYHGK